MSAGFTDYEAKRRELLKLLNQLRSLGADRELELPSIAVIGNQSAGKSSVVEAISRIKVPRDAGTCTRCPMECRMASTGPDTAWSCQVSIRRAYNEANQPLDEVSEIDFGEVITEMEDVEPLLRRAQVSVLNPAIPQDKLLVSSSDELKTWAAESAQKNPFSRNVVCVSIEGPGMADLSFIDLPGLIHNADEESTIELVSNMVLEHIKGDCLILVTIPMTDDIDNQKALKLARQVDPSGKRTIGVLTKPDMLNMRQSALKNWQALIEGRTSHPSGLGFFCTRQPDDHDRENDITHDEARAREIDFFQDTEPWNRSTHKQRLGTGPLVETLSRQLVNVIDGSLPELGREALGQLIKVSKELASLPEASDVEPSSQMLAMITGFCNEVSRHVQGGTNYSTLVHQHRDAFNKFKTAIRGTAPRFTVTKGVAFEDSDDESEDESDNDSAEGSQEEEDPSDGSGMQMSLDEMKKFLKEATTRELPGNIPFDAKKALIIEFQQAWPHFVEECFNAVRDTTAVKLRAVVEEQFARYGKLVNLLNSYLMDIAAEKFAKCSSIINVIVENEKTPFTQNTHYLKDCTQKWLAKYKGARAENGRVSGETPVPADPASQASTNPEQIKTALSALVALGYTGLSPEDLHKLHPADIYEHEMQVMAEIRGYFQIAYKRIIDEVPSLIDLTYVKAISNDLQTFLINKLELGQAAGSERCRRLLEEDPMVVLRREELMSRKKRLQSVQAELNRFGVAASWNSTR